MLEQYRAKAVAREAEMVARRQKGIEELKMYVNRRIKEGHGKLPKVRANI